MRHYVVSATLCLFAASIFISEWAQATPDDSSAASETNDNEGIVTERLEDEREASSNNPYVVSTHKTNFLFPFSYSSNANTEPYDAINEDIGGLIKSEEVQWQLSLKVQLNDRDLFFKSDGLFLGFTLTSWWQLYTKDLSSPFRETNYQPEVFYLSPTNWTPFGGNTSWAYWTSWAMAIYHSDGEVPGSSSLPIYAITSTLERGLQKSQ